MKLSIREITTFAMLGALMYASKMIMEIIPNVHLLGVFTIAFTLVFKKKALYPIYVFVFILGLFNGFATWWIPYLYLWTVLWGATMLLLRIPVRIRSKIPHKLKPLILMCLCGLHGLLYGTLYAPAQAILFGLNLDGMIAWIIAGLPWDMVHGAGNFVCGILILPITRLLRTVYQKDI